MNANVESTATEQGVPPVDTGGAVRAHHGFADRVGFWIFVAMVVLAPLPDGSVAPVWVELWAGVAVVIVLLASFRETSLGGGLLMAGLICVLLAYGAVAWLQSISPGPAPLAIWSEASQLLGIEIAPLSGSVRNSPLLFLGRPLLAALVLSAGIAFGADGRRVSTVLKAVVISACIYGLIGLIGMLFSISALRPFEQDGALTTFFINKNTTATYLGSAFLIVFALLFVPIWTKMREGRRINLESQGENRAALLLGGAGLFLLALLPLTQSRAGLLLTALLVIGCGAASLKWRRLRPVPVLVALLAIFAAAYLLAGDAWRERQAVLGFDTAGRIQAYGIMLGAIGDHPWLGVGLGSFTQSFPQFRTTDLELVSEFNIGHSTPIELMFEGGVPLALIVIGFTLVCALVLIRGVLRRPGDPLILAALLVGLLGALHSSIDFPLQIPGYLIVCLAIVGLGLGRSFLPREPIMKRRARSGSHRSAGVPEAVATSKV